MKKILFTACIILSTFSANANASYFDGFQNWLKDVGIIVNRGTRPNKPDW